MGRMNSIEEHDETLKWAEAFETYRKNVECSSIKELLAVHYNELRKYFALAVLGHSKTAEANRAKKAQSQLYRIRVQLEKSIAYTLNQSDFSRIMMEGNLFGASKKQGVSMRMPLWTCEPTALCANRCYAHDTLDAAPLSVLRGAINGQIAEKYENESVCERKHILDSIGFHIDRAIQSSYHEAKTCGWTREPRIRFSHVGEIVAYENFANDLANVIREKSEGKVICVVYTRLSNVKNLDPKLWVINFTLDSSSMDRAKWIPESANTVFSAFDGITNDTAYVNFLEHHRWQHCSPKGNGIVCPATLPNTVNRTCDSLCCDRCFYHKTDKVDS